MPPCSITEAVTTVLRITMNAETTSAIPVFMDAPIALNCCSPATWHFLQVPGERLKVSSFFLDKWKMLSQGTCLCLIKSILMY